MRFKKIVVKKQMLPQYKYSTNGLEYGQLTLPELTAELNVAIIQPGSWGDNINSTLMLKPIKKKYPKCQIDLYTTSSYYSAFDNNPYINNYIVSDATGKNNCLNFVHIYPDLIKNAGYSLIINASPCINPGHWSSSRYPQLGENLILSWARALDNIGVEYDLPLETLLYLRQEEISRVDNYISSLNIEQEFKVLMEVEGESGQSFWNPKWTYEICKLIVTNYNAHIFISKRYDDNVVQMLMNEHPKNIRFVGDLSIRECAHLYNKCQAFISISSGLSNACNTNWCNKTNKWIEVVNSPACSSYPIRSTNKTFWYQNDIELFKSNLPRLLYDQSF